MIAPPIIPDTIFDQAIAIADPQARAAFLDHACRHDSDFRRHAERMVQDHFQAGDFLDRPAIAIDVTHPQPSEHVVAQIGPYKLLEQIGEGGMGLVYMAEQQQPVRRLVALKKIFDATPLPEKP
jgi:eukaryotic-like serine/threonine-protein kinase